MRRRASTPRRTGSSASWGSAYRGEVDRERDLDEADIRSLSRTKSGDDALHAARERAATVRGDVPNGAVLVDGEAHPDVRGCVAPGRARGARVARTELAHGAVERRADARRR